MAAGSSMDKSTAFVVLANRGIVDEALLPAGAAPQDFTTDCQPLTTKWEDVLTLTLLDAEKLAFSLFLGRLIEGLRIGTLETGRVNAQAIPLDDGQYLVVIDPAIFRFSRMFASTLVAALPLTGTGKLTQPEHNQDKIS
jgi:hypothetical protein